MCGQTEEKEDRISKFPDELIHEILKYLDTVVAVQTSILSKRWLNIWTTLPCLKFTPFTYPKVPAHKFVRNFLKYRNQQSVLSTFSVDYIILNRITINYLLYHNVEHLRIRHGWLKTYPRLKSKSLKTLHLTCCDEVHPMHWTLPSLTSLYLRSVSFGNEISGFENLTDLTLKGHCSAKRVFNIKCPNLRTLTLGGFSQSDKLVVSVPILSCFKLHSWNVPELYAGDGFPCITEVDIHIRFLYRDIMSNLMMQNLVTMMQNLVTMFNAFRGTPLLKLSMETIQFLEKIPDFSRYQPSPLKNLKFLLLQGRYKKPIGSTNRVHEMPTISTNHVIKYLLSNSPSAEMLKGK